MNHYRDLTGRVFGRLTVIGRDTSYQSATNKKWICRCSCDGKILSIFGNSLTSGHTRSCGCIQRESASAVGSAKRKWNNGIERTLADNVYVNMKQRCYNPNHTEYHRYGGRGIKICEEWLSDKKAFVDWAISSGYRQGLTIERVNNDGNYSPHNCKLIPKPDQSNNRSTSRRVEIDGVVRTLKDWADISEVNYFHLNYLMRTDFPRLIDAITESPAYQSSLISN